MIGASAIISRFARAISTYEAQASVQGIAAERLADLLGNHLHVLAPRILEIGCGTGLLTRQIVTRFTPSELILNDICPEMEVCFANLPRATFLPGDAQTVAWPGTFDAIVSASAIQWFDDLGAFVNRCAAALPQGGLLAVSGFGPKTLPEIRELTGKGLDYPVFEQFVSAFTSAFTPLETQHFTHTMHFKSGWDVLRHLKETGVTATGAAEKTAWTRRRLAAFVVAYQARFAAENGVYLTYEPFLFVGARR